jgi:hypothetical protein
MSLHHGPSRTGWLIFWWQGDFIRLGRLHLEHEIVELQKLLLEPFLLDLKRGSS